MSKELTPLEALNDIEKCLFWSEQGINKIKIIETALYQKNNLERKLDEYAMALREKVKQEQALEIIKEKKVDTSFLFSVCYCSNIGGANLYNEHRKNKELYLTQEEYDLLKEVLL